jgi:ribose 5-phosphate isomerase B
MKEIVLASDHAGFKHKERVKEFLISKNILVKDFGALSLDNDDDYPDFILPAANYISKNINQCKGIIFGGSGQGEAIAANRIKGIRAVVYYNGPKEIIQLSRKHNDANILSIGARFISIEETIEVIQEWLDTDFDQGRHLRRINKLDS